MNTGEFKQSNGRLMGSGLEDAAKLPAVRWKQQHLDKLPAGKRAVLVDRLKKILFPD